MNNRRMAFVIAGTLAIGVRISLATLEDVFFSLHSEMGITNVAREAFVETAKVDRFAWLALLRGSRDNVSDTFLDGWYQGLTMADVPANSDWISTNKWLEVKRNAIVDMSFNPAVRDSTNCWMAVAREHGNIRARLIAEAGWDSLLGLDECEREAGSNGVEVISVPGLFSERWAQREKEVRQMKQDQSNREYYAAGIRLALKEFARSERIACLPPQSRNAMVSNIVETARLTQEEACALGWTNVAVSVSQ